MKSETNFRSGLDAKMVLKDALTLDMTLNPDFSQVESDEPQVTVNQRYEVFFPEKRPFFMEHASYFSTPQDIFFSRRIVDPEYGIRLTGKVGRWGLGILAADDRAPGETISSGDPDYGRRANNAVVSIQRDFLKDSHIRFLGTDREFGWSFNRVASLDTRLHFNHDVFFTGQVVTSRSRSLESPLLSGNAYYAQLSRSDRKLQLSSTYTDRSPDFRAELGFVPRTDIREFKNRIGYKWWREKGALVNFGPALTVLRNWNRRGQTQDWQVEAEWYMEFMRLTGLTVKRTEAFELYDNQRFRKGFNSYSLNTEWFKWLALQSGYTHGDAVNYYSAAGTVPTLGSSKSANVGLTLRPTPRLRLDETYLYGQLKTRSGLVTAANGTTIYNNHILRSKANYQFTRELSIRAILDYNGVLPNTSLVSLERSKRISYDLLATYLLHPGTALYVGYTDGYENLRLDPSRPPYLQRSGAPDMNTGRQVFVKMSYLLRF